MNGVHDLGGMQGFGAIAIEANEPVFHEAWERQVLGLVATTFAWGTWTLDAFRHQIERSPAADYFNLGYYAKWLSALEQLLLDHGLVAVDELRAAGTEKAPGTVPPSAVATPEEPLPARFVVGERVRARLINPAGHTRLPRYVRGRLGTIERDHGVFAFPDTRVSGAGDRPQHVYSVRFMARELWGAAAPAADAVLVDAWDEYLERA